MIYEPDLDSDIEKFNHRETHYPNLDTVPYKSKRKYQDLLYLFIMFISVIITSCVVVLTFLNMYIYYYIKTLHEMHGYEEVLSFSIQFVLFSLFCGSSLSSYSMFKKIFGKYE